MKSMFLIITVLGFLSLGIAGCGLSNRHAHESVQAGTAKAVYTCPMHPEVTSDKPGNCPKCGMTLVLKEDIKKDTTNRAESDSLHHMEHMGR